MLQHCLLGLKAFAWASSLGGAGPSFLAVSTILVKKPSHFLPPAAASLVRGILISHQDDCKHLLTCLPAAGPLQSGLHMTGKEILKSDHSLLKTLPCHSEFTLGPYLGL